MLPLVHLLLVTNASGIDRVRQHVVDLTRAHYRPAALRPIPARPKLRSHSELSGRFCDGRNRAKFLIEIVEHPHGLGFLRGNPQDPVDWFVAKRYIASHPKPLLLRGRDLVADTLGRHLAFKLREAEQHIERQPSHAGRGIEGLCDRDKRRPCPIQPVHKFREVGQRPRQPVDLVDNDPVDTTCRDIVHQPFQCRAIEVASRDAAVVVAVLNRDPSFMALAGDVGRASLSLCIERVEVLVQSLLARLAGVNCTASFRHAERFPESPKNRGPDQAVPVIRLATAESDA
ncbi:hypothetical protein BOA8489_04047 [Boseongicola aestuarii]|uniref:Uncharacterized protein n=1 Tax=Boseongicola aestuarii TaxID=1470561 RepID=A0A238J6P0_9RHOB|nr:hypothetical protein BOA8489_04047 [Boseongicola aestuarii]